MDSRYIPLNAGTASAADCQASAKSRGRHADNRRHKQVFVSQFNLRLTLPPDLWYNHITFTAGKDSHDHQKAAGALQHRHAGNTDPYGSGAGAAGDRRGAGAAAGQSDYLTRCRGANRRRTPRIQADAGNFCRCRGSSAAGRGGPDQFVSDAKPVPPYRPAAGHADGGRGPVHQGHPHRAAKASRRHDLVHSGVDAGVAVRHHHGTGQSANAPAGAVLGIAIGEAVYRAAGSRLRA